MPLFVRNRTGDLSPSPTFDVFVESSSEAAALPNGQRALTPIIAGSISGGCVVIAWIIALATYLFKRYRKKKRYKKFGRPDLVDENPKAEVFIVPPDPAVIQGQRQPGEHVFIDKKHGGKGKEKERATDVGNNGVDVNEGISSAHALDVSCTQSRRPALSRLSTIMSLTLFRHFSDDKTTSIGINGKSDENAKAKSEINVDPKVDKVTSVKTEDFAFGNNSQHPNISESSVHDHLYPPS